MSLTVHEIIGGPGATFSSDGQRQYRRRYRVTSTANDVSSLAVATATGIPQLGTTYATSSEADAGARVVRLSPKQLDSTRLIWEVDVEYSTQTNGGNPADEGEPQPENPLDRTPIRRWTFTTIEEAVEKDIDGDAVRPSSTEPFENPPTRMTPMPVLTIQRNEASFDSAQAFEYVAAVNSDTIMGADPGTLMMLSISADEMFENNVHFWSVTYEIHYKKDGWQPSFLDKGYYRLDGTDLIRIKRGEVDTTATAEEAAEDVDSPQLLDGTGGLLPIGDPPVYLDFKFYKEKAFGPLDLE